MRVRDSGKWRSVDYLKREGWEKEENEGKDDGEREREKGRARVLVKKKKQKRGETNESGVIMKKRE